MWISGENKSCCEISTIVKFNGGNCFGAHLTPQCSTCGQHRSQVKDFTVQSSGFIRGFDHFYL